MAMDRDDSLVDIRHIVLQILDDIEILKRNRITDGVRDINRGRSRIDDGFNHLGQEWQTGTNRVFAGELDVGGIRYRVLNRL